MDQWYTRLHKCFAQHVEARIELCDETSVLQKILYDQRHILLGGAIVDQVQHICILFPFIIFLG